MNDRIPTHLLVSAQIRAAAKQGIPLTILHKGDPTSGAILLKINLLNGDFDVLSQIHLDNEQAWSLACGPDPVPETTAQAYIDEQINYDPDLWVIEVEDKQGRPWFPGRIVEI